MLKKLDLRGVGPAKTFGPVEFAPRLNFITGDNGLGKSFLLDLAWWALTRTWAGSVALPMTTKKASINFAVKGKAAAAKAITSEFHRPDASWPLPPARPVMPGIVVYIRIDGGFSVWDPARNYWRTDPSRPAAYHFKADEVWNGLDVNGQGASKPQCQALESVLRVMSPTQEPLRAGPPQRVFIGEGRDRPTLLVGNQTVPVALASAGVRRILALVYFLVWAWHEHAVAAKLLGKKPEDRFVILFDEPETHLHPRWQRTVLPSLFKAVNELRGKAGTPPQVMVATHSPLVAASVEPIFDSAVDDLIHLSLKDGAVAIDQGGWATQGDVTNWLVSETFGLEQARSKEAEDAIEAAEAFMRGGKNLPSGLTTKAAIHARLQRLLPAGDVFWPRWIVSTQLKGAAKGKA